MDLYHKLINLEIDSYEFFSFKANGKREYLATDFTKYLSTKLQEKGIECWLQCSYNWFRKITSNKKGTAYWRGKYTCLHSTCDRTFNASIDKYDPAAKFVVIKIKYQRTCTHTKLNPKLPLIKQQKKELGLSVLAKGATNVITENVHNSIMNNTEVHPKLTDRKYLAVLKFKIVHEERLATEICADARAAKISINNLVLKNTESDGILEGYVQEIMQDPFGLILICILQVIKSFERIS